MTTGPDYRHPDNGTNAPELYQHAPTETTTPMPEERWWQIFGDQELDRMVAEALRNNLDIKKAAARILEVRSQFVQTRADRFPSLNFQGQGQRGCVHD